MAKNQLSLTERIAERARKKQKQARGGANRAEFLLVKEEVARALDDQWPVKEIWGTLKDEGSISFSYDAFMGYVRRLITEPRTSNKERAVRKSPSDGGQKPLAAKDSELQSSPSPPVLRTPAAPAFSFTPKTRTK